MRVTASHVVTTSALYTKAHSQKSFLGCLSGRSTSHSFYLLTKQYSS